MTQFKPITMDEIARLAKVSKPTVSRALNDSSLVNAKTKKHVLDVARKYGYAVNRNAQKLRHSRTHTVAVSVDFEEYRENHITDPFILELLSGVSEALGDQDQDLLLCSHGHNTIEGLHELVNTRTADGIIFLGQGHRDEMLEALARLGVPQVVWGAHNQSANYCVVGSDNFLAGQMVGDYFKEKARAKALFVGDFSHREFKLRYEGLAASLSQSANPIELKQIAPEELTFESALQICRNYLGGKGNEVDAIFTYNDTAAMATIRALKDFDYAVPDEVLVVGFNDIPAASHFIPAITTIRQNTKLAGVALVDKLMQILDGAPVDSSTIETKMVRRET